MDIQQGTKVDLGVKFFTKNSLPVDLTGKTVLFTIKKRSDISINDDNAILKKDITSHIDPEKGITLISLTPDDTLIPFGIYDCDFRINTTGEDPVNTPIFQINIVKTITKRV